MEISYDIVGTLRAQDHGHPPLVLQKTYPVESHPQDSRMKIAKDDVSQALTGKMGTGGGNVPMVLEEWVMATGQANAEIMEGGVPNFEHKS